MKSQKYILSSLSKFLQIGDRNDGLKKVNFLDYNVSVFVPEEFLIEINDNPIDYYYQKTSLSQFDNSPKITFRNINGEIIFIEDIADGFPYSDSCYNLDIVKKVIKSADIVTVDFDNGILTSVTISFYYSNREDPMHPSCEDWIIDKYDKRFSKIYESFISYDLSIES